jgi:lysophospholipase L1-like esterase
MPTTGNVGGLGGAFSFNQFTFANLPLGNADTGHLSQYDTAVLLQAPTSQLTAANKAALAGFVTGGGKLIIYDSDATDGNDYSWLPAPAMTGQSCPNCGAVGGTATVVENNTMVSNDQADGDHYVKVSELPGNTDAVGDANVMLSQDPRWFVDIRATNNRNETGAVHAYATAGSGLMIYNGFDTDPIGSNPYPSGVDWLAKIWFSELRQGWDPDGLPHGIPINTPTGPVYVAFGDSLTTGFSIPTCKENRDQSPWGCNSANPPATPYPDRVAAALGYTFKDDPAFYRQFFPSPGFPPLDLDRVGIWGYQAQEAAKAKAAGKNAKGPWKPQLLAVEQAHGLVTGALGINDLHFSDVGFWVGKYLRDPRGNRVRDAARQLIADRKGDFDAMFASLAVAKNDRHAKVVVTLIYNPYDNGRLDCKGLRDVGRIITDELDAELARRASAAGLLIADFRPGFLGHGAGNGGNSFVFGTDCSAEKAISEKVPSWVPFLGGGGNNAIKQEFDPHPNNQGTDAMAQAILKVVPR